MALPRLSIVSTRSGSVLWSGSVGVGQIAQRWTSEQGVQPSSGQCGAVRLRTADALRMLPAWLRRLPGCPRRRRPHRTFPDASPFLIYRVEAKRHDLQAESAISNIYSTRSLRKRTEGDDDECYPTPAGPLAPWTRHAPLAIDKLVPPADAAEARGVHIHYLNIGQPDLATPPPILAALAGFEQPTVAYAPSRGQPETLRAWSAYYRQACGAEVPAEHLLVTTGGGEAIVFAMMAVADPGDEILVFDPSYTSYCGFAAMAGVALRAVMLEPSDDYALPSAAAIEAALTPRTRAILLCNPNNPTGAVYGERDLRMLLDVAERHDLFLIVDEVYRELVFDGLPQTSILSIPEAMERTILIDSVSKRFNACGARVGCLYTRQRGDPERGAALRAGAHLVSGRRAARGGSRCCTIR